MTDPNWLLSTTAQSAAALVAIVGGFLVSRVVNLRTAEESLLTRRRETQNRFDIVSVQYQEVHSERLEVSREWFRANHIRAVVASQGKLDADDLLEDFIARGSEVEESRQMAVDLITQVKEAYASIGSAFSAELFPQGDVSFLRDHGVDVPDDQEDVYEAVAEAMATARRGRDLDSLGPFTRLSSLASSDLPYERQDARISREAELRYEIQSIQAEIQLIDDELDRIATPAGIRGATVVLSYLALVGVVVPLLLMTRRPVPDSPTLRNLVVGLFISGLAALIGYMIWGVGHRNTRS